MPTEQDKPVMVESMTAELRSFEFTSEGIDKVVEAAQELVDVATTKPTLKEKLQSRKFWACIALMVVGVCGMFGLSDNTVAIVVFAIMEILGAGMYIITEGYIDAVRAKELLASIGAFSKMLTTKEAGEEGSKVLEEVEQGYNSSEEG